ncbi:TRAP transporter substrate-binding protein [Acuticoccus kandeliae]|uniref:TRAP transporter substrate-binding protein n=1 Tax=Acuticoccus kandeliae TaxID=2073160 RepID=UPI00130037D2|nr:TRAP transporter substrate-binding protein [Acuticoccus kandeliae]
MAFTVAAVAVSAYSAQAQTTIRFATSVPEAETAEVRGMKAMADYIEFKSDGQLQVDLLFGTLGAGERELTEMAQQGAVEMALAADGAVSGFYDKLQVFAIPYLFKSSPVAWEFVRLPIAKEMQQEMLDRTGLRTVVWAENGFRNLTNSKHPVKGPQDMQGLKMRVMESPVYMRFMESLGAAATPISFSELVMSLQQRVVDGQENASVNVFENGMADVQNYFSTTEHIYSMTVITINDAFYQSLTPAQQQIIMEAGQLYASVANAIKVSADRAYVERIRDEKGLEVHITTPEEKEAFREVSQGAVVEYVNEQLGKEFVDRILAAVKDAETAVYGQ